MMRVPYAMGWVLPDRLGVGVRPSGPSPEILFRRLFRRTFPANFFDPFFAFVRTWLGFARLPSAFLDYIGRVVGKIGVIGPIERSTHEW
jgi:hypothetical protein